MGAVGLDHACARPCAVPGLEADIVALAAGSDHNLALTLGGSVLAWGMVDRGALGVFTYAGPVAPAVPYLTAPAVVPGLPGGIHAIAAGKTHSLAVTADGAFAWGKAPSERWGTALEKPIPPAPVNGLSAGVRAVAAGYKCSYAIGDDGSCSPGAGTTRASWVTALPTTGRRPGRCRPWSAGSRRPPTGWR